MTDDEERLERLADFVESTEPDPGWEEHFEPGGFGWHELVDRSFMLADFVDEKLVDHPALLNDPELWPLAKRAMITLYELYQKAAGKHVDDCGDGDEQPRWKDGPDEAGGDKSEANSPWKGQENAGKSAKQRG